MSSGTAISESDEGKKVVNADGDQIGMVVKVDDGVAHVDPNPSITDRIRSRLGWAEEDDTYPLPSSSIDTITDDEIRLKRDM